MTPLSPIHPSAGIEAAYQKRLEALVDRMHRDVLRVIAAAYRANPPVMAQDEAPITAMRTAMRRLANRWLSEFDVLAPKLATYFATQASDRVDRTLKTMLRDAGFTVKFKMTRAQRDAYQGVIAENVGLIRSIASQHLATVETLVMKSVQTGRDLGTLTKALQQGYGVTRRRATLIARTQNNMATAVLARTRQLESGISTAKWLHSAGGNTPRPSHVHQSGKTYDVKKGWYDPDEKQWTWPGALINCRCVSIPVVDALL